MSDILELDQTVTGDATPYFGSTIGDWDTITIGPLVFGRTKIVIEGGAEYKIDVKPAPGLDGASEKLIGYEPAKISVTIEIWNDDLMAGWAKLVSIYKPKPGKTKPVPVTVDHPLLRMYSVSRFYVTATPLPKALGNQSYEGRLMLLEYFDQPKTSGKQAPAITGSTVFTGDIEPGDSFEAGPPPPPAPHTNNTGPT